MNCLDWIISGVIQRQGSLPFYAVVLSEDQQLVEVFQKQYSR